MHGGNICKKSSDGHRHIVVHAGGDIGFVPVALQIFSTCKTNTMDGSKFENWYKIKLLLHLQQNSVVVMDNASYHCVQVDRPPTSGSTKADIQEWLRRNDVPFSESARKGKCVALVKQQTRNSKPKYVIDEMTSQAGHTVLRLPPYHSHLNPIEMIWVQIKRYVTKNNATDQFVDTHQLIQEAINAVTVERWRSVCKNVIKIEEDYWVKDNLFANEMCKRRRAVGRSKTSSLLQIKESWWHPAHFLT